MNLIIIRYRYDLATHTRWPTAQRELAGEYRGVLGARAEVFRLVRGVKVAQCSRPELLGTLHRPAYRRRQRSAVDGFHAVVCCLQLSADCKNCRNSGRRAVDSDCLLEYSEAGYQPYPWLRLTYQNLVQIG